jgi:ferrous iron transport protein A
MTVAMMRPGQAFRVKRIVLSHEVGKRLADMGFTEGANGAVVRRSLFGGPVHVRIRNYDVVLRRSEAAGVEAELSSGGAGGA